jgi:hypothetical protein
MPSPNPPQRSLQVKSYLIPVFALIMILVQLFFPFKSWAILASSFTALTLFSYYWAWRLKKNLSLEREMRFGWMRVGDPIQERIG